MTQTFTPLQVMAAEMPITPSISVAHLSRGVSYLLLCQMETKEYSIDWFEAGAVFGCLIEIAGKPYSKNVLDNFREFDPKQNPLGQYYEEQIRWGYALLPYCQALGEMQEAITGNYPGFGFDESKELIRKELERAKGCMDERAYNALSLMLGSCREAAVPEL